MAPSKYNGKELQKTEAHRTLLKDEEKCEEKDGQVSVLLFVDENSKKKFIFKVYLILFIQIIVTSMIVYILYGSELFRKLTYNNPAIFYSSVALMFLLLLIMTFLEKSRKKAPLNFILLGTFTIGESFLLAVGSIRFETHEILVALILCGIVCLALIIFASQSQIDFSVLGLILLILVTLLLLCGMALMFFPYKILTILYSAAGVIIFSLCLIYDTNIMLSGKHKHTIKPDDYCFAALSLYLDIINIFYFILLLSGFYRKRF